MFFAKIAKIMLSGREYAKQQKIRMQIIVGLAVVVSALGLTTSTGKAENDTDVAAFYRGKVIKVIVGFNPGGGYDMYARLLARHMSRHIPGNPTLVVQNMPGSGSLKAVKYLDTKQAADGTSITIFNSGLITQSLTAPEKVNVDFRNYTWLGSASEDVRVCFTWHTRNAKRWQDLLGQRELQFGATSPGTLGYIEARIVADYLQVPLRLIPGYPGSAEKRLAVEKGELEGDCGGWVSIPDHWLDEKKINVMIRFSKTLLPGMDASVPYAGDVISDPLKNKAFALLIAPEEIGRPFITSKEVPVERQAALRAAFDAMLKDPEFIEDAQRQQIPLLSMSAKQVQDRLQEIYAVSPDVVKEARRISGDE
jgi:tripartite-type tricarboxylate transporter receptor subunit TctC